MKIIKNEPTDRFSEEGVRFIIEWAGELLKSKKYPKSLVLNTSTTVVDCGHFLESMIRTIGANHSNPLFRPTISQLYQFKAKLEQG